jgi:hypothetical protein
MEIPTERWRDMDIHIPLHQIRNLLAVAATEPGSIILLFVEDFGRGLEVGMKRLRRNTPATEA